MARITWRGLITGHARHARWLAAPIGFPPKAPATVSLRAAQQQKPSSGGGGDGGGLAVVAMEALGGARGDACGDEALVQVRKLRRQHRAARVGLVETPKLGKRHVQRRRRPRTLTGRAENGKASCARENRQRAPRAIRQRLDRHLEQLRGFRRSGVRRG